VDTEACVNEKKTDKKVKCHRGTTTNTTRETKAYCFKSRYLVFHWLRELPSKFSRPSLASCSIDMALADTSATYLK
jgi:hypothetical protein